MSEIELLEDLGKTFRIAVGVIDVKSFHEETADDVATRIRKVLKYLPAENLMITADCGFSAIPRWLARKKIKAMTLGAKIIRNQL